MKYLNQTDDYSCAPVAIHNTCVFLKVPSRSLQTLMELCKTDEEGTYDRNFEKAISKLGISTRGFPAMSLHIQAALTEGLCVLLTYIDSHGDWHWSLATRYTDDRFELVNHSMKRLKSRITGKYLDKLLSAEGAKAILVVK